MPFATQQLEDIYPELTQKERENAYLMECKTAYIMQIGDIVFWSDVLDCAFEVSSMGIRVDEKSLNEQLTKAGCDNRRSLPFHKMLLAGELPLTMGGGVGQSRLCMLLLGKGHIGEVQVSVWDEHTVSGCRDAGIELL